MLWDTGTWEPIGEPHAGLKKGHRAFILDGKRLKGEWNLVRMKGDGKRENWLLIKANDQYAQKNGHEALPEDSAVSVKTGRSMEEIADGQSSKQKKRTAVSKVSKNEFSELIRRYPAVQLATLVDTPPDGPDWLHEIKFDGYPLLSFISGGTVPLITRTCKDRTRQFSS